MPLLLVGSIGVGIAPGLGILGLVIGLLLLFSRGVLLCWRFLFSKQICERRFSRISTRYVR